MSYGRVLFALMSALALLPGGARADWKARDTGDYALFGGKELADVAMVGDRYVAAVLEGDTGLTVLDTLTWRQLANDEGTATADVCVTADAASRPVAVIGGDADTFLVLCDKAEIALVTVTSNDATAEASTFSVEAIDASATVGESFELVAGAAVGESFYFGLTSGALFTYRSALEAPEPLSSFSVASVSADLTAVSALATSSATWIAGGDSLGRLHWFQVGAASPSVADCPVDAPVSALEVVGSTLAIGWASGDDEQALGVSTPNQLGCGSILTVSKGRFSDPAALAYMDADAGARLVVSATSQDGSPIVMALDLGESNSLSTAGVDDSQRMEAQVGALAASTLEQDLALVLEGGRARLLSARPWVLVTVSVQEEVQEQTPTPSPARDTEDSPSPTEEPTDEPTDEPTPVPGELDQVVVVQWQSDEDIVPALSFYVGNTTSTVLTVSPGGEASSSGSYEVPADDLGEGNLYVEVRGQSDEADGVGGHHAILNLAPDLGDIEVAEGDQRLALRWERTGANEDITGVEVVIAVSAFEAPDEIVTLSSGGGEASFKVQYGGATYTWPDDFSEATTNKDEWPLLLLSDGDRLTLGTDEFELALWPLTNDTTYWVAVRGVEEDGTRGRWSAVLSGQPVLTLSTSDLVGESGGFCATSAGGHLDAGVLVLIAVVGARRPRHRRGGRRDVNSKMLREV